MKQLLIFVMLALSAGVLQAQEQYTAAVVVEPTTGRVLFEKNANQPLPVASMTKMMTLLVVLDDIQAGNLKLDTPVQISARAAGMGGSQVYLKQGETFPVRDLIAATMVHSANDAAMALAEHVAGTGDAFVPLMNERAAAIGMKNSRFFSPHGLPDETGHDDDAMSALDAARLGIELMKHPLMRQLAVQQQMPFRGGQFTMYNPNHLLKRYQGATGIKTGFHDKAGFCVTGSAKRGDMELVTVVMGSKRKTDNFDAAAALLTQAFSAYKMVEPVKVGAIVGSGARVVKGRAATVPVVAGKSARILVPRRGQNAKIDTVLAIDPVQAPVTKGQQIGHIVIRQGGKPVARVPALAGQPVAKQAWWKAFWPF